MTATIRVDAIIIGSGHRKTDKAKVKVLADSIALIGLRSPITVLAADEAGRHRLVVGRHRVEAHRLLGLEEIAAEVETDRVSADLWEIVENLCRSELTVMQRSMLMGRYVKLAARKIKQDQMAKVAQVAPPSGGFQPWEQGIRAAARAVNVSRRSAQRAVAIAEHLTKPAQAEAAKLGLDNNQVVLLRASQSDGAADQVASLRQSAERIIKRKRERAQMKAVIAGTDVPKDPKDAFFRWYGSLDAEMAARFRIWILGTDLEAYFAELERTAARGGAVLH